MMKTTDLFWMTWMLFFCVANGVAVLACVFFVVAHYHEDGADCSGDDGLGDDHEKIDCIACAYDGAAASCIATTRKNSATTETAGLQDTPTACGKRKERDTGYGMEHEVSQGERKQRRRIVIAPATSPIQTTLRQRAFSCGDASPQTRRTVRVTISQLRRSVSCGNLQEALHLDPASIDTRSHLHAAGDATPLCLRSLYRLMANMGTHVRSVLMETIRHAACAAVDEVLTSAFSFMTYATLVYLTRRYSAVAIGVSLDLGPFRIEL